jgi:hypothetical protein
MGASKEVESLAARLEDFPGFDEMRAGSAAGSSCGETPMKDGGIGGRDAGIGLRSESDDGSNDVSDFQDATLVEIMRERIQELERENVALRWRERTAEARIEAEIARRPPPPRSSPRRIPTPSSSDASSPWRTRWTSSASAARPPNATPTSRAASVRRRRARGGTSSTPPSPRR